MTIQSPMLTLRSSVPGKRPAPGTRNAGELYVNFADKVIGVIDPNGVPVDLGGAAGSANVWIGDTPPVDPKVGQLWFNSSNGQMFIYYDDGNSLQWVSVSSAANGSSTISISETAPAAPLPGELWFNPANGYLFIFYVDPDSSQWVSVASHATSATLAAAVEAQQLIIEDMAKRLTALEAKNV
jgi:hypothetical protein